MAGYCVQNGKFSLFMPLIHMDLIGIDKEKSVVSFNSEDSKTSTSIEKIPLKER